MPNFPIEPGCIIQTTLVGEYQKSTILNVFHFKTLNVGSFADGVAALTEWNHQIALNYWNPAILSNKLQSLVSTTFTLHYIRSQKMNPTKSWYIDRIVEETGQYATGTDLPSDLQWRVLLQATRIGRGRTGGKSQSGMMTGMISGPVLTPTFIAKAQVYANGLVDDLNNPVLGADCRPVIWNARVPGSSSEIHGAVVAQEARVMRRRQFRIGI